MKASLWEGRSHDRTHSDDYDSPGDRAVNLCGGALAAKPAGADPAARPARATHQMTGKPLAGLRVLDFTTLLPGPLATLLLVETGAEVIKVERPGGEEMRGYAPQWGGISATFAMLN